jgi:hypothetical protein
VLPLPLNNKTYLSSLSKTPENGSSKIEPHRIASSLQ